MTQITTQHYLIIATEFRMFDDKLFTPESVLFKTIPEIVEYILGSEFDTVEILFVDIEHGVSRFVTDDIMDKVRDKWAESHGADDLEPNMIKNMPDYDDWREARNEAAEYWHNSDEDMRSDYRFASMGI